MQTLLRCSTALFAAVLATPAIAQDTTQAVRIGLTYQAGVKPGVMVLPIAGPGGDSLAAILRRDLDYGDRVTVIGSEATDAAEAARAGAGGRVNYELFGRLGAAAIVQVSQTATGVQATVLDVGAQRIAQQGTFAIPAGFGSPQWRMAVHGAADEIERWITGVRGIAQTRVLFVRAGRVYVIDVDGANERPVTDEESAMSPSWHPNGRHIAYSSMSDVGSRIHVRDITTGQVRRIGTGPGSTDITPIFSPDGRSIVYSSAVGEASDLVLAPALSAGTPRRITISRGAQINVSPSFSPDGRRLAYTSDRAGHNEVYISDVDGTNAELLTPYSFGDQYYRASPDWSPDGRSVAFMSQMDGRFQIMTINLRTRDVRQHTSEGINEDPSWAPDGRHLVFTSNRTGTKQLFVLDVESGRVRQLTRAGGVRLAAWSYYPGGDE
jgi:TolB protein